MCSNVFEKICAQSCKSQAKITSTQHSHSRVVPGHVKACSFTQETKLQSQPGKPDPIFAWLAWGKMSISVCVVPTELL